MERQRFKVLIDSEKVDNEKKLQEIIELKSASMRALASDYTFWDDMVNFVASGGTDELWAKENIDISIRTHKVDAAWVYNIDPELVYSVNGLKDESLKEAPVPIKSAIDTLFGAGKRFCHFFVYTSQGLMEIVGATIHPTADEERTTAPKGYFLVGKIWDEDYLKEMEKFAGSAIQIFSREEFAKACEKRGGKLGTICFTEDIKGWDDAVIAKITVSSEDKFVKSYEATSRRMVFVTIFSGFLAVGIVQIFIFMVVNRPLKSISQALEMQDVNFVDSLLKRRDEFGIIAKLVINSFRQKKDLIREIAQRRAAEEKIETIMKMKSKFLSMASHELRNPLTAIKEGISIVLDGTDGVINAQQKEHLGIVKIEVDRLVQMSSDILDFQKLEDGEIHFNMKQNDINEAAREAYNIMHSLCEHKGLILSLRLEEGLPKVKFDMDKIREVMDNLLSNAIKFTDEGSITVRTFKEESAVHVSVEDTGMGIKKEDIQYLFDSFTKLSSAKVKDARGTGLGLAICKEIIEGHKGKIWAESEPEKGSTFHFILPIG
jgi:signal transduction histidine kinase